MEHAHTLAGTALNALRALGQSIWLDSIDRDLIDGGALARLRDADALGGVTSNPAIFEKAIVNGAVYAARLTAIQARGDLDAKALYERLAIADVQDAADILRTVYESTTARDGYVSLEVSPYLAHDTAGTIDEARRLWTLVGRPNVMIKVPATPEGIPAIAQLIGEGINVNVTLLFSLDAYQATAEAYIAGLERLADSGRTDLIPRVASVASFFVSRVDTKVDGLIVDALAEPNLDATRARLLQPLVGRTAVANAKLAYARYEETVAGERWRRLAALGAQTQRLLWASTGTKNKAFPDVKYVDELIGPDTVNTVPPATLDAFRDHGTASETLRSGLDDARGVLASLDRAGISMTRACDALLAEGLELFSTAFDHLLAAVERRRVDALGARLNRQSHILPPAIAADVRASLERWRADGSVRRLWAGDSSLWTGSGEEKWLGWLGVGDDRAVRSAQFAAVAEDVKNAGFRHVLLLGMGGSSLCPDVMRAIFPPRGGYPRLHVLDSTDPAQIAACERALDLLDTLFIVSSKSGSTLEPNVLKQYFFERVRAAGLGGEAGDRFVAITDPGSRVEQIAQRDGFRHVLPGTPAIGGRYSALSAFGMAPAAMMGIDVGALLASTELMIRSTSACVPPASNPGVVLGTIVGVSALHGRDKLTLVLSPTLSALGAWIEQLIAESTGKQGRGVIPVDGEALAPPDAYGSDRLFAYVRLASDRDDDVDARVKALEDAGHPVVRIVVSERETIGQEYFRWEIATATAGAIMGLNPFDQPDVEASKVATRELTRQFEESGRLAVETPILRGGSVQLFTDERNATALRAGVPAETVVEYLRAHLARLRPGDYFALLAYVAMNDEHRALLQQIRHLVRERAGVATCLGFGPRFLHSTGQVYKGGPNTGVFLQITADAAIDLPIPGQRYTFGVVEAAQARGDFQVLAERGRRCLRVHLGSDVTGGLRELAAALME